MSSTPSPAVTSHELESSPEDVWRTITEPEPFQRWMGPGSSIQPVPGGILTASDPISGRPKVGRVTRVEPCQYISWIWRPLGADPEHTTTVEVELLPTPDGTQVTVTEAAGADPLPLAPTLGSVMNAVPAGLGTVRAGLGAVTVGAGR